MKKNYFAFVELIYSETAQKMSIANVPNFSHIRNMIMLVERVLNPAREYIGKSIHINSGYRSKELNKLVGGKDDSQHMYGKAADITTFNKEADDVVFIYIATRLVFDQLIRYDTFIHVSYSEGGNRNMIIDRRTKTEVDV